MGKNIRLLPGQTTVLNRMRRTTPRWLAQPQHPFLWTSNRPVVGIKISVMKTDIFELEAWLTNTVAYLSVTANDSLNRAVRFSCGKPKSWEAVQDETQRLKRLLRSDVPRELTVLQPHSTWFDAYGAFCLRPLDYKEQMTEEDRDDYYWLDAMDEGLSSLQPRSSYLQAFATAEAARQTLGCAEGAGRREGSPGTVRHLMMTPFYATQTAAAAANAAYQLGDTPEFEFLTKLFPQRLAR